MLTVLTPLAASTARAEKALKEMESTAQVSFISCTYLSTTVDIDLCLLCADINECSNSSLNNCHEYANCINEIGNYSCMCKMGFVGDGVNCTGTHSTLFSKSSMVLLYA